MLVADPESPLVKGLASSQCLCYFPLPLGCLPGRPLLSVVLLNGMPPRAAEVDCGDKEHRFRMRQCGYSFPGREEAAVQTLSFQAAV